MLTVYELRQMEERARECTECDYCDGDLDRSCVSFFEPQEIFDVLREFITIKESQEDERT